MGHNVPLILDDRGVRKLTPRECFRLQGFPDSYKLPPPSTFLDSHLYKQAGNSVSISLVAQIADAMLTAIQKTIRQKTPNSELDLTVQATSLVPR